MINCLITKLKGGATNPNLPVIETMQQFTLNAITASGNSSMTDEQKWALNHFFYQIGAIDDNGIFAKTKYLFIPMLCNQDKDKILVNYKDNVAFTLDSDVKSVLAFDSYSCPYNTGSDTLTQTINSSEDSDCTDLYIALGFPNLPSSGNVGAFRQRVSTNSIYGLTQTSTKYSIICNNFQQQYIFSQKPQIYGGVCSFYNNEYAPVLIESDVNNTTPTQEAGVEVIPVVPYNLTVQFANPIGISMWGTHLTNEESITLANAIRELIFNYTGVNNQ